MCIYSNFSHAEILESAFLDSCTPREILLRFLFLRLGDSGADDEFVSPYCEHCGPDQIGAWLCEHTVICHNVLDAVGKDTGEKMQCPDCNKWASLWLGMTREEAEASETEHEAWLNSVGHCSGRASVNQTTPTSSGNRGRKRNRSNSRQMPEDREERSSGDVRNLNRSATLSLPSAGSQLTNDILGYGTNGGSQPSKRARVTLRGSYYEPTMSELDTRHGIHTYTSGSRSEHPRSGAAQVQYAPDSVGESSRHRALSSDSYKPPRDGLARDEGDKMSTPAKQEPDTAEGGAKSPVTDQDHGNDNESSQRSSHRPSRLKSSDKPARENPVQSAHRGLLSATNAYSNLRGAGTMEQESSNVDDELRRAILDQSFNSAIATYFRRNDPNTKPTTSKPPMENARRPLTLKLRGGTTENHISSIPAFPSSTQHQVTPPRTPSSSSTGPLQQRSAAPPTPPSSQPQAQFPTPLSKGPFPSREQALEETIRRLRKCVYDETDRCAALARQLAETQVELAEARRREAEM